MATISRPLVVPIRVDACCIGEGDIHTELAAIPTADFAKLGETIDKKHKPWLGETVASDVATRCTPHNGDKSNCENNCGMGVGVHLHWSLPKALTHGKVVYCLDQDALNELTQRGMGKSLRCALAKVVNPGGADHPPKEYGSLQFLTSALLRTDEQGQSLLGPCWTQEQLDIYLPMIVDVAGRARLPVVPNRWLVLRLQTHDKAVTAIRSWVVESDCLTDCTDEAVNQPNAGIGPTAVPSPRGNRNEIPFQYLGKTSKAADWNEDGKAGRFAPLTAAGFGDPAFAAFYPNCRGVFGLCDDLADLSGATLPDGVHLSYLVVGWYDAAQHDPVTGATGATLADRLKRLKKSHNWAVADPPKGATVDGSLYVGQVIRVGWDREHAFLRSSTGQEACAPRIAVGNSTSEALSALLANLPDVAGSDGGSSLSGLDAETLLNAAQAGVLGQVTEPDGPALVENALHQCAFQPVPGGLIWQISHAHEVVSHGRHYGIHGTYTLPTVAGRLYRWTRGAHDIDVVNGGGVVTTSIPFRAEGGTVTLRGQANAAVTASVRLQEAEEAPLPSELAHKLNCLNQAQIDFDRQQAQVLSQRAELFADCWRYQMCLSPFEFKHLKESMPNLDFDEIFDNSQDVWLAMRDGVRAAAGEPEAAALAAGAGLLPDTAKRLRLALQALRLALEQPSENEDADTRAASLSLTQVPAPRYWKPHDPVMLVSDAAGSHLLTEQPEDPLLDRHDADGALLCSILVHADAEPAPGARELPDLATGPAHTVLGQLLRSAVLDRLSCSSVAWKQPWRPLYLGWAVNLNTMFDSKAGEAMNYPPGFLAACSELDANHIDRDYKRYPQCPGTENYAGRVLLSGHGQRALKDRILQLTTADPAQPPETLSANDLPPALQSVAPLLAMAYAHDRPTLSQSLHGFHDAMLMRSPSVQLDVYEHHRYDPNFDADPAPQVGLQNRLSPVPDNIYNPIRAGFATFEHLYLVDSFGQVQEILFEKQRLKPRIYPSAGLKDGEIPADDTRTVAMPPRFCQASRLLFRWLAADPRHDDAESNSHPATTPVCGWLALNRLDDSVMFYEADGTCVGAVSATEGQNGKYLPPPGQAGEAKVENALLRQVLELLTKADASGKPPLSAALLFDDISNQLLTIEPHSHQHHSAFSVLASRPLALARASLRLELQGPPAPDQGWDWLKRDHHPDKASRPFLPRETRQFEQVEVPVRLGDVSMDDDGLVLHFRVDPATGGKPAEIADPNYDLAGADGHIELTAAANAPAQVLLLFDPRARVHLTSGLLPVKSIDLPPDYYAEALRQMQLSFETRPVLTPADGVALPVPAESHGRWQWLRKSQSRKGSQVPPQHGAQDAAQAAPIGKIDDRAHLTYQPPTIEEGWLQVPKQSKDR